MKQVTLHIPDKKYNFFMELIKSLGFVEKVETDDEPQKEDILSEIEDAVQEAKLIKQGKLKGVSAQDLLKAEDCFK